MTAAAAAAVRPLCAASTPNVRFPTAPRDRLAVASYPFRAFIDSPRRRASAPGQQSSAPLMQLTEFPAMVVKRFNIRNVELLGDHLRSTEPAYLAELHAAIRSAGVRVVDIPTGIGASVYDPDPAKRDLAVTNSQRWIDAAATLESPSVRVHIQGAQGVQANEELAAKTLARIAAYGASKNVVVTLENDSPQTEDAFFLVKVIDLAATPWLRALPDFCNSMLMGDEDFNYRAVTEMFRRAYSIAHTKDVEVDHGKIFRVDLKRTYGIAKAAGYKGYFSMEFEGEGDPYEGTQKLIDQSLQYLA
jgi:sugar phosphate isomerase/epimerase